MALKRAKYDSNGIENAIFSKKLQNIAQRLGLRPLIPIASDN